MWNQLIHDETLPEVTVVIILLVAIALWQRLPKAALGIGTVFIFYVGYILFSPSQELMHQVTRLSDERMKTSLNINGSRNGEKPVPKPDMIRDERKEEIKPSKIVFKDTDLTEEPSEEIQPNQTLEKTGETQPLRINSLVVCTDVKIRTPVGVDSVFHNSLNRLYCVSGIKNLNPYARIHHNWYYKGRLKSRVSINMKWSYNWRSWSYITLNPGSTGPWKVVLTDSAGTELDSVSFSVIEADSLFQN